MAELVAAIQEDGKLKTYTADRTDSGVLVAVHNHNAGLKRELLPGPSQKLWNHSPGGFEWGYGGSGPAQLALAILLDHLRDPGLAVAFHQPFKFAKIATAPREGFRITSQEIDLWIAEHTKEKEVA